MSFGMTRYHGVRLPPLRGTDQIVTSIEGNRKTGHVAFQTGTVYEAICALMGISHAKAEQHRDIAKAFLGEKK